MANRSHRYSRMLFLITTVLLVITLAVFIYYLNIKENERYHNRLYFRELSQTLTSIEQRIEGFQNLGKKQEREILNGNLISDELSNMKSIKRAFPSITFNRNDNDCPIKINNPTTLNRRVQLLSPTQTCERGTWKLYMPFKEAGKLNSEANDCKQCKTNYSGSITMNLADLLPKNNYLFPLILLVNDSGKLIYRKENIAADAFQNGLTFETTDEILNALAKRQIPHVKSNNNDSQKSASNFPGFSGQIEIVIAGEKYQVFISPWVGLQQTVEKEKNKPDRPLFYVIGITPKSHLTAKKLSIPNSTLVAIVFFLLAIMALTPFIKMRLTSYRKAFNKSDRQHLAMGLSLLAILLVISTVHLVTYQHWKGMIKQQNIHALNGLKNSFRNEVSDLLDLAKFEQKQKTKYENMPPNEIKLFDWDAKVKNNDPNEDKNRVFFENAFYLLNDGIIRVTQKEGKALSNGQWSSKSSSIRYDLPVAHRKYFNAAKQCQGWELEDKGSTQDNCTKKVFIQRIMSLVDGRKTTQFSIPLFKDLTEKSELIRKNEHIVYSFGGRLKTFLSPVLPLDSGFAVIDNSGQVLYHSDDERSLVENMFVETDNNAELRSYIQSPFKKESINFKATYHGKTHRFFVSRIHDRVPWTLIVFQNKENIQNISMLIGFSAMIVMLILVLLCHSSYLLLQAIKKGHLVRGYTWFNRELLTTNAYFPMQWILLTINIVGLLAAIVLNHSFDNQIPIQWLVISILSYWMLQWFGLLTTKRYCNKKSSSDRHDRTKRREISPDQSEIHTYSGYLFFLVFAFWSVPSFFIVNESIAFYLQKYSNFEYQHVLESEESAKLAQQQYLNLVVDKPNKNENSVYSRYDEVKKYYTESINVTPTVKKSPTKTKETKKNSEEADNTEANTQPHSLFSRIWQRIELEYDLVSRISVDAKATANLNANAFHIESLYPFSHNNFLKKAFIQQWYYAGLLLVSGSLLVWWILLDGVCYRLMGLSIPQNLRLNDSKAKRIKTNALLERMAITNTRNHQAKYIQLIRPTGSVRRLFDTNTSHKDAKLGAKINQLKLITDHPVSFYDLQFDNKQQLDELLADKLNIKDKHVTGTLVLSGLEMTAANVQARQNALQVLSQLITKKQLNIILLADISPLFRLTRQGDYPNITKETQADVHETVRWGRLLRRFVKFYDWTPCIRENLMTNASSYATFIHEAESWPELKIIRNEFLEYHVTIKDRKLPYEEKLLITQTGIINSRSLEASINQHWLPEQVVEFFAANAVATYRYRWELCTQEERLLLIQVAHGAIPNPRHLEPIEHLLRRGYLYRYNGWHIVNKSFTRYLLTAENEKTVVEWMNKANESSWQYIRIPLFAIMVAVLALLAFTATEALQSVTAVLTATLGILPFLVKGFSMLRGDSASAAVED